MCAFLSSPAPRLYPSLQRDGSRRISARRIRTEAISGCPCPIRITRDAGRDSHVLGSNLPRKMRIEIQWGRLAKVGHANTSKASGKFSPSPGHQSQIQSYKIERSIVSENTARA